MSKDIKEDIYEGKLKYFKLSLISKKTNVCIIGSGRGGLIKARYFLKNGCNVTIVTKDEFNINGYEKAHIIRGNYKSEFITNKHIVVIAVNDKKISEEIKLNCETLHKIYIDATSFKEGMAVVPVEGETKNTIFSINTKGGNPNAAMFLAKKVQSELSKYDDYISFTTNIRNSLKNHPSIKGEVLKFIFTEDFLYFFNKGKADYVLKIFYCEVEQWK